MARCNGEKRKTLVYKPLNIPKIRLESLTVTPEGEIKDDRDKLIDEKTGEKDDKATCGEDIRGEENDEERVNISDKFTPGVRNYS